MLPLRARYGRTPSPLDGITGAVNAHFGLEGADRATVEQTLIDPLGGRQGRRRGAHVGRRHRRVAAPDAAGRASRRSDRRGKRFVLDRPELRFVVIQRVLERLSRDRPVLLWLDDLHYASPNTFEMLSRLRRDAPELPLLIVATARSETLATDLDAALRMEAMRAEWSGKVLELKPLGDRRHRGAPAHRAPARRRARSSAPSSRAAATRSSRCSCSTRGPGGGYLTLEGDKYSVPERRAARPRHHDRRAVGRARARHPDRAAPRARTRRPRSATTSAATCSRRSCASLGMDPRDALVALTRAQILLAAGNDQFRWPHALLQEHLLERLHERNDAPAIYRLAANALAQAPGGRLAPHHEAPRRRTCSRRATTTSRPGSCSTSSRARGGAVATPRRRCAISRCSRARVSAP